MSFLQLLAVDPDGAGNFRAVGLILFRSAQIQDHDIVQYAPLTPPGRMRATRRPLMNLRR